MITHVRCSKCKEYVLIPKYPGHKEQCGAKVAGDVPFAA